MKILIAYFSKSGCTKKFAKVIESKLISRGHTVEFEIIKRAKNRSWFVELFREIPFYPSIGFATVNSWWRKYHLKTYRQIEEAIEPLSYPDITNFDIICIGGPKWGHISYPVARYINTVNGLAGKKVGAFATFGGPPFKIFELELISNSMKRAVTQQGAEIISEAYISSNFHEAGFIPVFEILSRIVLKNSISNFTLGSDYANNVIKNFCDDMS
jgi:flavodoxin